MNEITPDDIAAINSFPKLVSLLRDKMEWPLGEDYGFDDVVYEYDPKELGFKPEETAKIREIHQLRPLVTGQPWGIFFVSFEDKKISVTVLRRMLRALVLKKRSTAQAADRQSWQLHDLIFVANFGGSGEREIAFAHFSENEDTGDLPVMKVLGWNAKDTKLHNKYVGEVLRQRLIWPEDHTNVKTWRETWREAFELRQGEAIQTSKDLAIKLAELAIEIRARANELIKLESDSGPMRQMHEAFRKNLIQDLDADGFADMFAQTISYGMLAAKISRPGAMLIADNLADMVPRTNPFLKELFGSFLSLGGRDKRKGMDFDELGVNDVVDMLNTVNMAAVLRDFGNRNPKKDPVIHFYEDFLGAYDKAQKVDAGVFYTPPAVVGFIVRGVDEMLRTEFELPLGLADTTTWAELTDRSDKISLPEYVDPNAPFVQILDPATGTGTFIVEAIDLIYKRMVKHWSQQGLSSKEIETAWNSYVPQHLLPRLTAFELKMAAYAIAHMKVGLKLSETGYKFDSDERAQILLTNSLQPSRELDLEERMRMEAMAHEAGRANDAKDDTPFTVVIGNPPYKGHSENPSKIKGKLTFAGEIIQRFFKVRGEPLNERNPKWLNNDYVKFIAFAMKQIEDTGFGVVGYITSNSWLESPTFRGVRTGMIDSFPRVKILDLHGNIKKREIAEDGTRDEGVFAIEEGTNISIIGKLNVTSDIRQSDLLGPLGNGTTPGKLRWLEENSITNISSSIIPLAPFFSLAPMESTSDGVNLLMAEFYAMTAVTDIQPINSAGIVTANDTLCVQFSKSEILSTISDFLKIDISPILANRDQLGGSSEWKLQVSVDPVEITLKKKNEAQDWQVEYAQADLRAQKGWRKLTQPVNYRPFDQRYTIYTGNSRGIQCRPRPEVMQHMTHGQNIGLVSTRQRSQATGIWGNVFAADNVIESTSISNKTKEINYLFPLWLNASFGETYRRPNIDRSFAQALGKLISLTYQDGIPRGEQQKLGNEFRVGDQESMLNGMWNGRGDLTSDFGPRDLFDYIYAVLHSPRYRTRYAEFLKSDFPRIPTPQTRDLFAEIIPLGQELVALHLTKPDEASVLLDPDIRFAGSGEARVERTYPKYENGKVMINSSRWFEDVPQETWDFYIGGYRVCEKWLKDRSAKGGQNPRPGRVLTDEDILHYRRIVTALTETRRIMTEIDQVIENHGGWPDAFALGDKDNG